MSNGKVYVMHDGSGLVKIGKSKAPENRLKRLLIGNPLLKIVFLTDSVENPSAIESACHRKLKHLEVANEWFDCDVESAIEVVKSCFDDIKGGANDIGSLPIGAGDAAINRMICASNAGIKIKKIADLSGITYFRVASAINPESYRGSAAFNSAEIKKINRALDSIKNAF